MDIDSIINRNSLRDRLDGDMPLFVSMVELFLKDSAALMESLDQAVSARNVPAVAKFAHTLKGSVANFSAQKAFEACLELETLAKSEKNDAIPAAYLNVKKEISLVSDALNHMSTHKVL